jgi:hypothetical protein
MLRSNPLLINKFNTSAIFCSYKSFLIFFLSQSFFILPLHQVPGSTTGDTIGLVGEVVVEGEKYPTANQQVQHVSHFLFTSVIFL